MTATNQPLTALLNSDLGVGTWQLDPARTAVRMAHKTFWGLMTVRGSFRVAGGSGEIGPDRTVTGVLTVDAASVDTGNAKRDAHLRSAAFLDADTHPHLVFSLVSAAIVKDRLELAGELTVRGVRQPVTLVGEVTDLDASTVTVHVSGAVDRHRFGVSGNQLGMIRGRTRLEVDATFSRVSSA